MLRADPCGQRLVERRGLIDTQQTDERSAGRHHSTVLVEQGHPDRRIDEGGAESALATAAGGLCLLLSGDVEHQAPGLHRTAGRIDHRLDPQLAPDDPLVGSLEGDHLAVDGLSRQEAVTQLSRAATSLGDFGVEVENITTDQGTRVATQQCSGAIVDGPDQAVTTDDERGARNSSNATLPTSRIATGTDGEGSTGRYLLRSAREFVHGATLDHPTHEPTHHWCDGFQGRRQAVDHRRWSPGTGTSSRPTRQQICCSAPAPTAT